MIGDLRKPVCQSYREAQLFATKAYKNKAVGGKDRDNI